MQENAVFPSTPFSHAQGCLAVNTPTAPEQFLSTISISYSRSKFQVRIIKTISARQRQRSSMKRDPSYPLMLEHLCNLFTNSALLLLLRNRFAVPKIVSWFSVLLFRTEGSDENRKNQFPFTPETLKSFKQHQKQAPRRRSKRSR